MTPDNLRPDYAGGTLTVELHRCGSALQVATIADLCAPLHARLPSLNLAHVAPPPNQTTLHLIRVSFRTHFPKQDRNAPSSVAWRKT